MKLTIKELNLIEDLIVSELEALDNQDNVESEIAALEELQEKIIKLGDQN